MAPDTPFTDAWRRNADSMFLISQLDALECKFNVSPVAGHRDERRRPTLLFCPFTNSLRNAKSELDLIFCRSRVLRPVWIDVDDSGLYDLDVIVDRGGPQRENTVSSLVQHPYWARINTGVYLHGPIEPAALCGEVVWIVEVAGEDLAVFNSA